MEVKRRGSIAAENNHLSSPGLHHLAMEADLEERRNSVGACEQNKREIDDVFVAEALTSFSQGMDSSNKRRKMDLADMVSSNIDPVSQVETVSAPVDKKPQN